MNAAGDTRRLPCGTSLASLVDQVAEGIEPVDPEHQVVCPYCQAALRELEQLWGTVREMAREDVAPPSRLIEKVVVRIRRELRALGQLVPLEAIVPALVRHALLSGPRGSTRIADAVIARIVAKTTRDTPGIHALSVHAVRVVRGGLSGSPASRGVEIAVAGHSVTVEVRLVVEYGRSIPHLAAEVRRRVVRSVEALTGLEATRVDVLVDDVFGDPEAPEPRRFRLSRPSPRRF